MRVTDGRVLALVNPREACLTLHPPGSIFKLVTAFAALQERSVIRSQTFRCDGWRKVGGILLHCTIPNGHGRLTLPMAIAQSCNVTFYGIGLKLGSDRLLRYARLLGLDEKCRSYSASQSAGTLPKPRTHPADVARLAMGQADGFAITVLEAAEMTRRVAGGSIVVGSKQRAAMQANLALVRSGMRLAVTVGTCRAAALPGIAVAGKTGSPEAASNPDDRSAWFIGFAPYDRPEVVVAVFALRGHGYSTAAPVARRMFEAYFGKAHR